jgi:hypothetical protein
MAELRPGARNAAAARLASAARDTISSHPATFAQNE